MKPSPGTYIRCAACGKAQQFKHFSKFRGSAEGTYTHRVLKKWWNKIRPDGTYNDYIMDSCQLDGVVLLSDDRTIELDAQEGSEVLL